MTSTTPSRPIEVGDHQFRVNGSPESLYGGAVHYWRLDRDKWDDILDKVKGMGFTTISIYMPWEAHELQRGVFDWGQVDPRTDLDAFLTLIESKGMRIVARPGPQINSEMTWFGYPRRILEDPELQALNAQGTKAVLTQVPRPIPALAYASDKFHDETALWYDAIMPILAKHAYPKGGLVAAQIDNEMAYFFGVNAYAADFSPSSLARYRAFLAAKYGSIEALNGAYGSSWDGFEAVDPPRRWEARSRTDIPWYADWVAYRERYLVNAMGRLADMMRARGLGDVALFHNYPHPLGPGGAASGFTAPFNITELEEKLDFVGFDIYSRKELYEHVRTIVSYVVGTSRYPYVPEFISGVWPWYLHPGDLHDEEFVTKAGLMNGIKGFSRYMIVERDRWMDSPVRRDGRVRPEHYAMFKRANEMALAGDFARMRRRADVLLLANRDYDRLEAASVLVSFPGDFLETPSGFSEYPTFMTVSEAGLGFEEPIQVAKAARFSRTFEALAASGYAFLLSDTALAPERWSAYRALVVGTYEYLDAALQRNLLAFARDGGTVVIGPRVPSLDTAMRPDDTLAAAVASASAATPLVVDGREVGTAYVVGQGRLLVVPDGADTGAAIAAAGDEGILRFTRNDPRLDVTIHADPSSPGRDVVYVANPTGEAIDAEVDPGIPLGTMREIWGDRPVQADDGRIRERLEAYTINVYESVR